VADNTGNPYGGPQGFSVNYQFGAAPRAPSPQEVQARVRAFARQLEPRKICDFQKIRVGRNFDGGYVMVDDFNEVDAALSFGIADDASWDLEIAKRGIPVHQFDHTIEKSPVDDPGITFHKTKISGLGEPAAWI